MNQALRLAVFLCVCSTLLAQAPDADKARVFITDSQSWSIAGAGGGANGAYGSTVAGGARPQTAEIIKTFGQRCPQVVINNKQEKANYIVLLDHEGGKGYLRHKNKVAVFNRVSGDSIVSKSTLSLGGSVQDACEAITADWSAHSKEIRAAEVPPSPPNPPAAVPIPVAAAPAPVPDHVVAASAQLQISSTPDAADIEIDGSFVGNTPSTVGVAAGAHQISVKKTGFKPWERKITVSSGQVNVNATLEPESK
ncbi:MAG: PEGA domain-containing protein [Terriglobales bacterium]